MVSSECVPHNRAAAASPDPQAAAFAGGLIFAMTTPELAEPATALRYAVAASCLKHSIKGDFNFSTRAEVQALMGGSASGRVVR